MSDGDNSDEYLSGDDSTQGLVKRCIEMKPEYRNKKNNREKVPTKSESLRMTLRSSMSKTPNSTNADGKTENDKTKSAVDDAFKDFKTDIQNLFSKLDNVYSVVLQSIDNVAELEKKHDELSDTVDDNSAYIRELEFKYDDLERKQRLNKALLTSSSLNTDGSAWKTDINNILVNKFKVDKSCMWGINISKFGKGNNTVLLEFISPEIKRQVFATKKSKLGSQEMNEVYLNDFLSPKNLELLKAARELKKKKKLHAAFSAGGLVFIKLNDKDDSKLVKSMDDLIKLN